MRSCPMRSGCLSPPWSHPTRTPEWRSSTSASAPRRGARIARVPVTYATFGLRLRNAVFGMLVQFGESWHAWRVFVKMPDRDVGVTRLSGGVPTSERRRETEPWPPPATAARRHQELPPPTRLPPSPARRWRQGSRLAIAPAARPLPNRRLPPRLPALEHPAPCPQSIVVEGFHRFRVWHYSSLICSWSRSKQVGSLFYQPVLRRPMGRLEKHAVDGSAVAALDLNHTGALEFCYTHRT
ncbi:uncharacterized protein LOC104584633 [Brachypodium distachyon]|uniref:uncharacterized protein LOC104584633 n=1 Tax=Brachypodium distachyon TaxID=15368 RepID=UPI000D0D920A|nr:uncharacterized protein LOC104584633 [Brachypodium distachyon]|eukprot:XP_024310378.1 uncharacterized protein LOC104584633 [Brachypodium distachyon]